MGAAAVGADNGELENTSDLIGFISAKEERSSSSQEIRLKLTQNKRAVLKTNKTLSKQYKIFIPLFGPENDININIDA